MADKYKRMSDEEIGKLIDARIHHAGLFKTKFYKRDDVWLAVQITANLTNYTLDQIRLKWNYLYKKYKELLSPPTGVGSEDGTDTAGSWKWFGCIHGFAQSQHVIHPPIVASSVPGATILNPRNSFGGELSEPAISEPRGNTISILPADPIATSAEPQPSTSAAKKRQSVAEILMKDSKRLKKEGKCIMNFLSEYAKRENIPFQLPSSSESD